MRWPHGAIRLSLLLSFCIPAVQAAPRIEIYGNQIFDDEAVRRMAGVEKNQIPNALEIKRRLETTSLFSHIDIETSEELTEVFVREKLPGFVLPFYFSDENSKSYGVAAGIFGVAGEDAYLVGRYQGGKDKLASVLYRNEFFLNSPWITGLSVEYENTSRDNYFERDVVDSTANKFVSYSALVGYHFLPSVSVEMNTHVEIHRFEEQDHRLVRGTQVSHRVMGRLGNYFLREGLARGTLYRPYFEFTSFGDFHFLQGGIFVDKSLILDGNFNWIVKPRAEWGNRLPRYQLFQLGAGKLRSFPQQMFRSNAYTAVQNDFLLTAWDVWKLKFRPLLYTDWAYVQGQGRTGLGAGLQLFFPKVVAPAIQVYAGYGFNPNGFSIILAVGPQI